MGAICFCCTWKKGKKKLGVINIKHSANEIAHAHEVEEQCNIQTIDVLS